MTGTAEQSFPRPSPRRLSENRPTGADVHFVSLSFRDLEAVNTLDSQQVITSHGGMMKTIQGSNHPYKLLNEDCRKSNLSVLVVCRCFASLCGFALVSVLGLF